MINPDAARAREASDAGIKPDADSIINVKLMCSRGDDEADDGEDIMSRPCSDGSLCMEGDLGVYCECYVPEITGSEVKVPYSSGQGTCTSVYKTIKRFDACFR